MGVSLTMEKFTGLRKILLKIFGVAQPDQQQESAWRWFVGKKLRLCG